MRTGYTRMPSDPLEAAIGEHEERVRCHQRTVVLGKSSRNTTRAESARPTRLVLWRLANRLRRRSSPARRDGFGNVASGLTPRHRG